MSDRELLELAALAAGITLEWGITESGKQLEPTSKCFYRNQNGIRSAWNPLEDDGDALRLAVKLLMDVDVNIAGVTINWASPLQQDCRQRKFLDIQVPVYTLGVEAATRRAIVRAAAEIGKGNAN